MKKHELGNRRNRNTPEKTKAEDNQYRAATNVINLLSGTLEMEIENLRQTTILLLLIARTIQELCNQYKKAISVTASTACSPINISSPMCCIARLK